MPSEPEEERIREIVAEAVRLARATTPGNMCDEAVVQHVLHEEFVDGRWVIQKGLLD